jgi:hypothetical protein
MEDVLWFYEELEVPGVEDAVFERLTAGESLDAGRGRANYGKLMERLLFFRTKQLKFTPLLMAYAEDRLREMAGTRNANAKVFLAASSVNNRA